MSGDGDPYSDDDIEDIFQRLVDALLNRDDPVGQVKVTADIQWAGEYNRKKHRPTTLDPVNFGGVRDKVQAAVDMQDRSMTAGRRPPPKSVGAQVRALRRTKAGRDAWEQAGLTATPRTVARWLSGKQAPSKANRERLERAALSQHYARSAASRERVAQARREAVDAFTETIQEPYGSDIRLFNITSFDIE